MYITLRIIEYEYELTPLLRFKYDPASLRSALFPYTRCPKRRRLDDEDMDVDDVDEGVAETNSDETPRRSVVVETSRESFCIYPCGGGPVESGLQEKENIDDGGTSVRGRRYSVALRVAHDDDETNDEAEKHSPCPTKKTVEAPWPALEQPSPTTCTGAPTSPDAATEAKVSSPVRVNGISETTLEPLHLKSSLLPLDAVRPPSKCSVEVLQRDLREDQLIFEDGGITVLGSKVDGDGMMRGWRIEVRTWRWGEL
ncbi:hypothetical protein JAAARDRAFT_349711 [Jaapia argillacea MUCL 33604]|uniref:Uncharacterized protein n=1 Tax=Jaapia argillacea MUCL 33604 TaxID=933084 RepID=A0A067PU40_9AGAM|nr:hypothetical protein JAAARDRAFT_349711 [Jaapia argillacea MUCL 33604]